MLERRCYLLRQKVDNTFRDLHNSSDRKKAKIQKLIILLFTQNISKIVPVFFICSLANNFSEVKGMFSLADIFQIAVTSTKSYFSCSCYFKAVQNVVQLKQVKFSAIFSSCTNTTNPKQVYPHGFLCWLPFLFLVLSCTTDIILPDNNCCKHLPNMLNASWL